ncbi:hypothetical protein [Nonomuraea sp. NPDC049028]|uniref:hypothetical protein n=1 Tax=Nonomuraea sp. NPDC049028 TaxID=3364348 RepID=UPI0037168783
MNDDEQRGLLGDGTYRAHWLRAVMRSPQVTDSLRVLLMTLALLMDANGRVSVPRKDLAALLERSDRKMADKFKVALKSGFLVQTARGQKNQTAVYMAAIDGRILSMTVGGHPETSSLSMTVGGQAEHSQGDGYKHPENEPQAGRHDSQGDGYKHPESWDPSLSMTPEGQAEESMSDSQHDPRGSSQGYKGSGVEEAFDLEASEGSGSLFDVRREAKPEQKPDESAKRKTQVPKNFAITHEMRAWAAEKTPLVVDLEFETEQFVDHWTGKRELRADWLATWRTWMRNQQKWTTAANARQKPSGQQGNGSGSQVPEIGKPRRNPFRSKRESA